jgi:VanZ family protein
LYRKLFIAYAATVIILAVLPINGLHRTLTHSFVIEVRLDYLLHSLIFIPFLFLLKRTLRTAFLIALLYGILFATFSEGIQYFLPYRTFNINDLLANWLGVVVGGVLWRVGRVLRK